MRAKQQLSLLVRIVLVAAVLGIASSLLFFGVTVHLRQACVLMDTPYLPLCPEIGSKQSTERQQQLRSRLAANPGEADSWVQLTNIATGEYEKPLLQAVARLAPNDPNVLLWRAGDLLARSQFEPAVDLLVELVENRQRAEAADALARIMASGQGTPLLLKHLGTADRWLPRVLVSLTTLKLPLSSALPLMAEAVLNDKVSKPTVQLFIKRLRDAGFWGDAYGLWLVQQREPTPLLHNGQFNQPFQRDGFDWEVTPALPSRAGAVVNQRSFGKIGQALDVQFTGRPVAIPVIRQYVFAPPGKYLLRGQYMGSKMKLDEGLAWAARCTNGNGLAGRSSGLEDTSGAWKSFEFVITILPSCGVVFSLQLETLAAASAAAGIRGRAAFDSFELVPQSL